MKSLSHFKVSITVTTDEAILLTLGNNTHKSSNKTELRCDSRLQYISLAVQLCLRNDDTHLQLHLQEFSSKSKHAMSYSLELITSKFESNVQKAKCSG